MSGPPYPHPNPAPGSNAIGQFQIGISPIGSIPAFDFWSTVISQYANSPILMALLASFADAMDLTEEFDDFFDNLWNIATAQGYGLDVIGRRLDVGRVLQVPTGDFFGFAESNTAEPWNQGTFFTVGEQLTSSFALADTPYRVLLYAKALSNICDGGMQAINALLRTLFPNRGNCYVLEGGIFDRGFFGFNESIDDGQPFNQAPFYSNLQLPIMWITYKFDFHLSPVEFAIVSQSGVIPTPTGVFAQIVQAP